MRCDVHGDDLHTLRRTKFQFARNMTDRPFLPVLCVIVGPKITSDCEYRPCRNSKSCTLT